ncbi:MAG: hypothetical protein D6757_00665 [Alphaproteobacteria bacterium]|nr:MAG: hypothetical protein D6757_00665 [Alphaproteobacteria bacterium]
MLGSRHKRRNVHFEVHGLRGSSWTVLEIFDDQGQATRAADKLFRSTTYQAVRVLKERYDPKTGQFHSFEILYKGRKLKPSKFDAGRPAALCESPQDFFSQAGRRTIAENLRSTLDQWEMTPLEILYNLDNYLRLDQAGTAIQAAVQRAAVSQVKETGESVGERMKKLYQLIDTAVADLKKFQERGFPVIDEKRFSELLESLSEKEGRRFILCGAIAADLRKCEGAHAKLRRLVALMGENHPRWVARILDNFISETLMNAGLIEKLLDETDVVERLIGIGRLARGRLSDTERGGPELRDLNRYLQLELLPATREMLLDQLGQALKGNTRLSSGNLRDRCRAIARLKDHLIREELDFSIEGTAFSEILETRCARLLNAPSIAAYLEEFRTPADKLAALLDLEPFVIGPANKRMLANYMLPLVTSSQNEAFWCQGDESPTRKARRLVCMQQRVLASSLQELHREMLAGRLDQLCVHVYEEAELFQRLRRQKKSAFVRAEQLLALIADGYFTEGRARELAVEEIKRYMRDKSFMQGLAEIDDSEERKKRLLAFRSLLARAGIAEDGTSGKQTSPASGETA